MFGKSNVTWNPVSKPDVTMKEHCIIRSACNDKVIDASENVFDKTVSRNSVFCATVYMYLEKRSPPLGDGTPYLCVHVSKDLSLASNRL